MKIKKVNLEKKILNLKGKEVLKSGMSQREIDNLPKRKTTITIENGEQKTIEVPDENEAEKETIGNIILNCLANYKGDGTKVEGFYKIAISQWVLAKDRGELKDKIFKYLLEVLEDSIIRNEEKEVVEEKDGKKIKQKIEKGIYYSWAIAQVFEELGEGEKI